MQRLSHTSRKMGLLQLLKVQKLVVALVRELVESLRPSVEFRVVDRLQDGLLDERVEGVQSSAVVRVVGPGGSRFAAQEVLPDMF